jgi:hypothetical protein
MLVRLVNDEFESMWVEGMLPYLGYCPGVYLMGLRVPTEHFRHSQ